jgi:hypothetical protein
LTKDAFRRWITFMKFLDIQGVTRRSMKRRKFICITRECKKKEPAEPEIRQQEEIARQSTKCKKCQIGLSERTNLPLKESKSKNKCVHCTMVPGKMYQR